MDSISKSKSKAGFTLAEILLAMMVFAIAISTILALLARSIETADSILIKDEAIGLSSTVDSYMSELPFVTAFGAVEQGINLYTYRYRAEPQSDGSLAPYPVVGSSAQLGSDYVIVSGVRPSTDPDLDADIEAIEGRLFYVKLTVSDANPLGNDITNRDPISVDATTGYNSAVLVIFAEFYVVPNTSITPTGSPVFSFNFAVRR